MTDAEKRFLAAEDGRQFSYFAFISYKHRDMRWGRWLQKKLEGYRLPEELRREKGLPKRVTPVFRDETDIGTGSTVKNSDVIMVLDHGRIIERGSHDQLIAQKGQYYQLYTGAFELE